MAKEIIHRIQTSVEMEKGIVKTRNKYLPVASRGTILYFVVADLVQLDYMYQFSLEWFNKMFIKCVQDMNSNQTLAPQSPVSGTLRPRSALRKPAVKKEKRGTDAGNFNLYLLEIINMFKENIHKVI